MPCRELHATHLPVPLLQRSSKHVKGVRPSSHPPCFHLHSYTLPPPHTQPAPQPPPPPGLTCMVGMSAGSEYSMVKFLRSSRISASLLMRFRIASSTLHGGLGRGVLIYSCTCLPQPNHHLSRCQSSLWPAAPTCHHLHPAQPVYINPPPPSGPLPAAAPVCHHPHRRAARLAILPLQRYNNVGKLVLLPPLLQQPGQPLQRLRVLLNGRPLLALQLSRGDTER